MGTGAYIGYSLLFSIPLVGWIICIITAFGGSNLNKRNFARAMLVFLIIGVIVSILLFVVAGWVREAVLETAQGYISETTGGAVSGLDELKDLTNILGGLDLSALPGQ